MTYLLISSSLKLNLHHLAFCKGGKKKSQIATSGEHGGCAMTFVLFLASNSCTNETEGADTGPKLGNNKIHVQWVFQNTLN